MNVLNLTFNAWDWILIGAVSIQGAFLAYVHRPALKAMLVTLPIPFTLAAVSLGNAIDVTNVLGMLVLLLYTYCVRVLHIALGWNIIMAIAIAAIAYCVAGSLLAVIVPATDATFWISSALTYLLALFLYLKRSYEDEKGHSSSLPVITKMVIIAGVIILVVIIKRFLHGFMTFFPMVGVIAAYEMRYCLNTLCRQIPVVILTMLPMLVAIRLSQKHTGLPIALFIGWIVFLAFLAMFYSNRRKILLENTL